MYNMDNKAVAFVDANGDLIPKVKLEPWTDLYTTPPVQSVQSVNEQLLEALKTLLEGFGYTSYVSEEERQKEPDVIKAIAAIRAAEPAPKALFNGLTQQETEQTASCFGLLRKTTPLVRLTEEETIKAYMKSSLDVSARIDDLCSFANTLQDAWIAKNGGKV